MTKLSGGLPKGEGNGLSAIARKLLDQPHHIHAVIMLVDCKSTKVDHDTGDLEPTARIRRIEPVRTQDLKVAQAMLRRAFEARAGKTVLPYDLEQDLLAAFEGIDPSTGEMYDPPSDAE